MSRDITTYTESEHQFYPTPAALVRRMLEGLDFDYISTVLEPSAGKGDILREIARKTARRRYVFHPDDRSGLDIDCIEIDPYLRQILKHNFSNDREKEIRHAKREIEDTRQYISNKGIYTELTEEQKAKVRAYEDELATFFRKGINIVHDDFMTFQPFKEYNLIIMNPPFEVADKHLLKALDIQRKGGLVVCLMNAETIRKPYTETRKELRRKLDEYGAKIEFIENAFLTAERKTAVEVALIKVAIPHVQEESTIYNRMKEAEQMNDFDPTCTDLEVTDFIKAAVSRFNVEVKAGMELIREYRALIPYMLNSFDDSDKYKKPILRLTNHSERGYDSVTVNEFLRDVRLKYWRALLSNQKFVGRLTSKLQKEYRERVDRLANYDFSEFNIQTLSVEMNAQVKQGIEDEIMAMFDRLTAEHTWYPETQKNRHYFDGWATNKAHKIGKKVIIPCHLSWDSWNGNTRVYEAQGTLADIEKILNYLDGGMTREVNLHDTIKEYIERGETKNIPLKYFTVTFFKKGTCHIVFNCPELVERFNIYAAQNKNWLPPCYGKKKYADMTTEEKAVVDSFQGQEAYNEVLAKSAYYLAPVTQHQILMLEGA